MAAITADANITSSNWAFGRVASASEEIYGNGAQNAIDGDPATRWRSTYQPPSPPWWQVDLGAARTFQAVTVAWSDSPPTTWRLQAASAAAGPWTDLATVTVSGATQTTTLPAAVSYRYVRMQTLTTSGGYGPNINEFSVDSAVPVQAAWKGANGFLFAAHEYRDYDVNQLARGDTFAAGSPARTERQALYDLIDTYPLVITEIGPWNNGVFTPIATREEAVWLKDKVPLGAKGGLNGIHVFAWNWEMDSATKNAETTNGIALNTHGQQAQTEAMAPAITSVFG